MMRELWKENRCVGWLRRRGEEMRGDVAVITRELNVGEGVGAGGVWNEKMGCAVLRGHGGCRL